MPTEIEEFRVWAGKLDVDRMPAARRLSLFRQFQAQKANPPQTSADRISAEVIARYGSVEAALEKMTAQERLAMAHASAQTAKPKAATPVPMSAALRDMPAHQRGAAVSAIQEAATLQREIDQLSASKGGGGNVLVARANEIAKRQQRLNALKSRWPTLALGV